MLKEFQMLIIVKKIAKVFFAQCRVYFVSSRALYQMMQFLRPLSLITK